MNTKCAAFYVWQLLFQTFPANLHISHTTSTAEFKLLFYSTNAAEIWKCEIKDVILHRNSGLPIPEFPV